MTRSFWSNKAHDTLVSMAAGGSTAKEIGLVVGRSQKAIHGRARRTGIELQHRPPEFKPRVPKSTYQDHYRDGQLEHCWAAHTLTALRWHYGDRANLIATGRDPKTQADLTAWGTLGERRVA